MRTSTKGWTRSVVAAGLIAALLLPAGMAYSNDRDGPDVYSRDSVIFGRAYGEWSAAWRQWSDSLAVSENPLFDNAPCSGGQSGPVWFLGGRFCAVDGPAGCFNAPAIRSCTVPEGTALYFPVLNISCLDGEAKLGFCLEAGPLINEMRAVVTGGIDQTTGLQVTVDGERLKGNLKKDFRVQSPVYSTTLPDGNLYQGLGEAAIVAGNYLGVDDGIYVMLKPLRKGDHTLNFKGTFPQFNFVLDFTYFLTVQ